MGSALIPVAAFHDGGCGTNHRTHPDTLVTAVLRGLLDLRAAAGAPPTG
ncbi:hypothetical protein ACQP1W_29500 [Spirillospora sp. CA-255316]